MSGKERTYTTVNVPLDLTKRIDDAVSKRGYQSRAEFVRDAIRRLLEDFETRKAEEVMVE